MTTSTPDSAQSRVTPPPGRGRCRNPGRPVMKPLWPAGHSGADPFAGPSLRLPVSAPDADTFVRIQLTIFTIVSVITASSQWWFVYIQVPTSAASGGSPSPLELPATVGFTVRHVTYRGVQSACHQRAFGTHTA